MKTTGYILLAVVVLIVGSAVIKYQTDDNVNGFVAGIGGGPAIENENASILQNPNQYTGEITVVGRVEDIVGNGVFTLIEEGADTQDTLYVIPMIPPPEISRENLTPDAKVRVIGEVRILTNYEIEQLTGRSMPEDETVEPRPVLLAKDILRLPPSTTGN